MSELKITKKQLSRVEIIQDIEVELSRFRRKLEKAKAEVTPLNDLDLSKDFAAAKRAAHDLKRELTKLTQAGKYMWGNY